MFTRRRPVPSLRTVRFLYQLGYICSGTAFGLATLCLEEQRRRIQILQRVADNAKIIRQHPRYRGNVTLAFDSNDELENDVVGTGWIPERLDQRRRRGQLKRDETNEGAAQNPTLPSVVEREYAEAVDKKQKRLSPYAPPRHSSQTSWAVNQNSSADNETLSDKSLPAKRQLPNQISKVNIHGDRGLQDMPSSMLTRKLDSISYQTLREARYTMSEQSEESILGSESDVQESSQDATKAAFEQERAAIPLSNVPRDDESIWALLPTHSAADAFKGHVSPQDLSHDLSLFFDSVDTNSPEKPQDDKAIVANELFRSALAIGSLNEIRNLSRWKLSNDLFTRMDARHLCNSFEELKNRLGQHELNEFFLALFESNEFMKLNLHVRSELGLRVLGNSFEDNIEPGPPRFRDTVLQNFIRLLPNDVLAGALQRVCADFISSAQVSIATNLFLRAVESRKPQLLFDELLHRLFDATIVSGNLMESASLLRWKAIQVHPEELMAMVNALVHACGKTKTYAPLVDLFREEKLFSLIHTRKSLRKPMSVANRVTLATALSTEPTLQRLFELLYRDFPVSIRSSIDNASISSLRAIWKATRNFDEIETRIQKLTAWLKERPGEGALRKLDETAFEIYVSAGQMDRALATIARMHKFDGASNVAICQTALMFAKQASWDSFAQLLRVMKKLETFRFDEGAPRVFNDVIRVYSQHHGAEEVWDFVAAAIKDLKFTPTRYTLNVVLRSFVRETRLDLLPKWIELLTALGHDAEVDAQIAADLLRQYYMVHRPPHGFIMRLCRKLAVLSPSLASENLVALVEEAIGYDLRHISGQHAPWQEAIAKARLERLKISRRFVPSPGVVWGEQLHFRTSVTDPWFTEQLTPSVGTLQFALKPNDVEIVTKEAHNSQEDPLYTTPNFESLRSTTEADDLPNERADKVYNFREQVGKQLETDMWLKMSVREYSKVLELYHANLDAVGLPASPILLEIAVEACLRLHNGDRAEADAIMCSARKAGMNTTCALGPLILHQLKRFDPKNEMDVANLRKTVIEYYRSNDIHGWRVMHYLGLSAAHTLIIHGYRIQGLGLLSSIYTSKWAKDRPLDIVAMTIFLKGYIATQSLNGIRWVVQSVLEKDLRITRKFMRQLRFLVKGNFKWMDKHPPEVHPLLESWFQLCKDRQMKQTAEIYKLGWDCVEQIARFSKEAQHTDVDTRSNSGNSTLIEEGAKSNTPKRAFFVDESYYSDESIDESKNHDGLAETRRFLVDDWNAEQEFRRRMITTAYEEKKSSKVRYHRVQRENWGEEADDERNLEDEFQPSESRLMDQTEDKLTVFQPFP